MGACSLVFGLAGSVFLLLSSLPFFANLLEFCIELSISKMSLPRGAFLEASQLLGTPIRRYCKVHLGPTRVT